MALPAPSRQFPHIENPPPQPTFQSYSDAVAASGNRLWQKIVDHLVDIGGSANAVTASCSPPLVADPVDGQLFQLVTLVVNTGAVTVDIDGRGAVDLKSFDGSALASGDIASGETLQFRYDALAGDYILTHRTQAQQVAAVVAEIGDQSPIEQFGDSGNLGTVAQVEFAFVAGRYSKVIVVASDMLASTSANFTATLRNSAGAIVTMSDISALGTTNPATYHLEFAIGLVHSTKRHIGAFYGADTGGSVQDHVVQSGSHASAPDRVRVASGAGNLTGGRVMAYGLKASL